MANIECNLKFIICIFKTMIFQGWKNSPDGANNTGWNRNPVLLPQMPSGPKGKLPVCSQPK